MKWILNFLVTYQEAVGKDLDSIVAERGCSELKVTEMTDKDLGGHGHDIADHVNEDGRASKVEK